MKPCTRHSTPADHGAAMLHARGGHAIAIVAAGLHAGTDSGVGLGLVVVDAGNPPSHRRRAGMPRRSPRAYC
jgi:hypothetical protein